MLKHELLAPATLEGCPQDDIDAARAMARRAAAALRDCAAALGPGQLDRVVLDDVAVEDMQRYLRIGAAGAGGGGEGEAGVGERAGGRVGGGGAAEALRGRPGRRLACIADVLGAVRIHSPGFRG